MTDFKFPKKIWVDKVQSRNLRTAPENEVNLQYKVILWLVSMPKFCHASPMDVHERAARMTEERYREQDRIPRDLKAKLQTRMEEFAKKAKVPNLDEYRRLVEAQSEEKIARQSYQPPVTKKRRKTRENLVDLDYLRPDEVDPELERMAREMGYEGHVAGYLNNDGHWKKQRPDPVKSLKRLEKNVHVDKDGNKSKIDPQFRLYHNMKTEE